MANIIINNYSMALLPGTDVRFDLQFTFSQTPTEARLGIPCHIWVRLMSQEGNVDSCHMYADSSTTLEEIKEEPIVLGYLGGPGTNPPVNTPPTVILSKTKDLTASDWLYVGLFDSSQTISYSLLINTNDLPQGSNVEKWYFIAAARPDIMAGLTHTDSINFDI